ncbi:Oidioi.mRNA.OKI2018_I69.XSR.g13768.t1.cds [Oikopleura dioica]|uniref:Hexosyltransferase n=1 Tax=Oikopleura dioica TaxID=34765 RepID=A0ABN7S7V7_OIKDI|nr:Oidioi.mRNA.OKI2018_I69.XSR.g13768.t1.cds [Oikopleura dioica]
MNIARNMKNWSLLLLCSEKVHEAKRNEIGKEKQMIKILHGRNYGHLRTQNPQFNFKFHFVSAFNHRAGRKSPNFITEIARVLSSYPHPAEWTIILPKYQQNIGNPNWLDHLTGLEGNYLVCAKEGKLAVGSDQEYSLVFVIGAKGLSDSSGELKAEIELNDDFLIALFEDSYESLPHKTFATLQYLTGVCKDKFEYLLFIDDDTLLDLERISQFLLSSDSSSPFIRCLPGNYLSLDAAPYTGKYFLFPEMWPVDYKPPKYCNGQCSLWSKTAVTRVFKEALRTDRREFRLEDFFFSGILREKARVHNVKGLKYTNKDGVSAGLCRHFPKNGLADFISKNFEDDGNKTRKLKIKDVNFLDNVFLDAF